MIMFERAFFRFFFIFIGFGTLFIINMNNETLSAKITTNLLLSTIGFVVAKSGFGFLSIRRSSSNTPSAITKNSLGLLPITIITGFIALSLSSLFSSVNIVPIASLSGIFLAPLHAYSYNRYLDGSRKYSLIYSSIGLVHIAIVALLTVTLNFSVSFINILTPMLIVLAAYIFIAIKGEIIEHLPFYSIGFLAEAIYSAIYPYIQYHITGRIPFQSVIYFFILCKIIDLLSALVGATLQPYLVSHGFYSEYKKDKFRWFFNITIIFVILFSLAGTIIYFLNTGTEATKLTAMNSASVLALGFMALSLAFFVFVSRTKKLLYSFYLSFFLLAICFSLFYLEDRYQINPYLVSIILGNVILFISIAIFLYLFRAKKVQ